MLFFPNVKLSISVGLRMKTFCIHKFFKTAMILGAFQGGMTCLGWSLGTYFHSYICDFDHWLAFIILGGLGGKMIYDSFRPKESNDISFSNKMLCTLDFATSIDAFAIGISLAFLKTNIWYPTSIIAVTTCTISFTGILCGFRFGKIKDLKVELLGGLILIFIGFKILIEHTLID